MLVKDLIEAEGELLQRSPKLASELAKQLVRATQEKLYQGGQRPSLINVKKAVDIAAKRLYNDILVAIDNELSLEKEKVVN